MFENQTYETIIKRALERVPSDVDKRQGSIIWDALAPACAEISQMYIELNNILNLTFAETSFGNWLEMRCRERGVHRREAVRAIRLGIMKGAGGNLIDVPMGTRFSIETLNYIVIERLKQGHFKLRCEQAGVVGNRLFGRLIPVDNVRNLVRATLDEIIVPGEDTESDQSLFARYEERLNTTPFSGNIDDYTLKTKDIEGVGDCKIIPVWNGGGTVKVIVIDSAFNPPSNILIERVQQILDPVPFAQEGRGIAPIGHLVTVEGVEEEAINIEVNLTLLNGTTIGQVQEDVEKAINDYFLSLRQEWAKQEQLIIRVAQLVSNIISINGIEDVKSLRLNNQESNIILDPNKIPVKGVLNVYE